MVLKMTDGGPLVPQLAPNLENISKIERTASLALIMRKYHANPGVNRAKSRAATAASVKHKCYSITIIMYYLKNKIIQGSLSVAIFANNYLFAMSNCSYLRPYAGKKLLTLVRGGSEILISPCNND